MSYPTRTEGLVKMGDVVTEIFKEPRLCSVCSAWHRVLLPDVVFQQPSSQFRAPLPPPDTWCRLPCWVWDYVGRWIEALHHYHMTTANNIIWNGCLVFINIGTSCGGTEQAKCLFCEFTIWFLQNFFSYEKKQSMFSWRGCLSLLKTFAVQFFLLSFKTCDKNWSFLIL